MKLSTLFIMVVTLTSIALAQPAKADAHHDWNYAQIEAAYSQIQIQVYSGQFEGEELAIMNNLLRAIEDAAAAMHHDERAIDEKFNKTAAHLPVDDTKDELRELYRREYLLENQLYSLNVIMQVSHELESALEGRTAMVVLRAVDHVAQLHDPKVKALQNLRAQIAAHESSKYEHDTAQQIIDHVEK